MGVKYQSEVGYGNWHQARSAVLGRFSALATVVMIGGLVVSVVANMAFGLMGLFTGFTVTALATALIQYEPEGGHKLPTLLGIRMAWFRAKTRRESAFVGGLLNEKARGAAQLPGAGTAIELWDCQTGSGADFVLIEHKRVNAFSVVFETAPEGNDLVDAGVVDQRVAVWGAFLADLGYEPNLIGASVVVESAPDMGERLRNNIVPRLSEAAPAAAVATMEDVMATYPEGAATTSAYVTLTWSGEHQKRSELAREIASRVPGLAAGLNGCGAGGISLVTAPRLARIIRQSYDPDSAAFLLRRMRWVNAWMCRGMMRARLGRLPSGTVTSMRGHAR
ncbi:hypothetical protein H8R18_00750 [Nanchangia anserum]|nr:SCO6880 family protein [Nanchangia anserum]QOX81944.1 hypothetical protein H8R18_00750 [Nanchangia anserum]